MKKLFSMAAALLTAVGTVGTANAALVNAPVPTNAYITYGGLQWAWASPLGESSVDLSYQAQFGWRLPTDAELANAPSALLFIFRGANVPLNGVDPVSGANWQYFDVSLNGDAALATPYFSTSYFHGDWCNGIGSNCDIGQFGNPLPWNRPDSFNESLVVRGAVPEPATWGLMIAGFGLVGAAARRRRLVGA